MPFFTPVVAYSPARCYRTVPVRRDYNPFFSLINQALSEIEESSTKYQQPQKTFTPRFDVWEAADSYQVEGELPGIEQNAIDIQLTDEHTLTIKGRVQQRHQAEQQAASSEQPSAEPEQAAGAETVAAGNEEDSSSTIAGSEREVQSEKSFQATVEDDFEDLADSSDITSYSTTTSSKKGKEKAVEPAEVPQQQREEEPRQQPDQQPRTWLSERSYGSFERTFRFSARVNPDAITASLKNGVLAISVPKAPVPQLRSIQIE